MGAIVAATYSLRDEWYRALLSIDLNGSPQTGHGWESAEAHEGGLHRAWSYAHTTWNLVTGWGATAEEIAASRYALETLLGPRNLDDGRVPVTVCATDLRSGSRVEFGSGPAVPAVYASSRP